MAQKGVLSYKAAGLKKPERVRDNPRRSWLVFFTSEDRDELVFGSRGIVIAFALAASLRS
ncbi:MAG: hypothetical protein N3G20_00890 [Verrucomicrobiae bacterium]|nr:hypothetical protein [Verrucomicrobiae bacterium]